MISLFSTTSLHTSSYHRLSLCFILLLSSCFAGIFAAGLPTDNDFNVQQITDDDSLRENLDSIFDGNIIAVINSTSPCLPSSYTFGPYQKARLTIGPNHRPGLDPNPYFLSFAGGEDGEFFGGMQSSITSQDLNDTYWALQAWEHNREYEVTGTLMKSVDERVYGERNGFGGILAGKLGKDNDRDEDGNDKRNLWSRRDKECRDEPKLITWAHTADGTTLLGTVNENEARMTLTGSITVTYQTNRRDDNEGRQRRGLQLRQSDKDDENTVQLQYTLTFSGQHNSDSAPLPQGGLVWNNPGSGTPLETFKIPRVSVEDLEDLRETTTTSTSKTRTSTSIRTSTTASATSSSTSTITPTSSPNKDDDKDDDDENSGLPKGSIIAIVLGTVLFFILLAAAFFFGRAWWERRKQPKVYPELAYIYSTPFTVRNTQKKNDPNSATRGAYGQLKDENVDTEYRGGSAGVRMSGAMTGFGKETGIRDSYYAPEDSEAYDGGNGLGQGGGGYMMAGGAPATMTTTTTTTVDREEGDMGVGGGRVSERVRVEEESGMRQPMLQGNSGGPPPGSRGSHGESYWSPPSSWV